MDSTRKRCRHPIAATIALPQHCSMPQAHPIAFPALQPGAAVQMSDGV